MLIQILLGLSLLVPILLLIVVGCQKLRSQRPWVPSLDADEESLRRIQDGEVDWCRLRDSARIEVFIRCGLDADSRWVKVLPSEVLVGEFVVCRLPLSERSQGSLPLWSCWSRESIGGEIEITLRKVGSEATQPNPTTAVVEPRLLLCGA